MNQTNNLETNNRGDISQAGGAGNKDGRYDTALWQRSLCAAGSD